MKNKKISIFSFGEYKNGKQFKVLDERSLRASAGIMFLLGLIAFINGFILQSFEVIPYVTGFLLINFAIGVFINPKFSPTMIIGNLIVSKQTPIYVGAIQKQFAWGLGLLLTIAAFTLSILLLSNPAFFPPLCLICLICLIFIFVETSFGICIGCNFYFLAIKLKLIKKPKNEEKPNCTGDSCDV